LGGDVVGGHVIPGEIPELVIFGSGIFIGHRHAISSVVSQPHIISGIGQNVGEALIGQVQDRTGGTVGDSVLEEEHSLFRGGSVLAMRDSDERETPTIRSFGSIVLCWIAPALNHLHNVSGRGRA